MTSYHPTVRCDTAVGPEPRDCIDILLEMPTTKIIQMFGRAGGAGVEIELPLNLSNGQPHLNS